MAYLDLITKKVEAPAPKPGANPALRQLEQRCPRHVDPNDWELAVNDARRFLTIWGRQAEALGWTTEELFGLAPVPDKVVGNYRRLSRYDLSGLIWLLRGRPVVALTATGAAIKHASGNVTVYRKA